MSTGDRGPNGIVFADRSERGKLQFGGPQHLWFLHQILTQSFEDMQVGEAREAALLTVHGRMVGFLEAVAIEEGVLCHFEPEQKETLPEAIGRYVLATQVTIDDVSDEMGLVLVAGEGYEDLAHGHATRPIVHSTESLGVPAAYLWVGRSDVQGLMLSLDSRGARQAAEDELEAIRIANGRPRWGRDMDEKSLPQETRIDERAVHYEKGCYVGQEAMAKIHFRGKVNRKLRTLEIQTAAAPGADVQHNGETVGNITSAADNRALALLRHTIEPGTQVTVGAASARVIE
ncbi:MAG: folate-binding protein YgfZ [Actinomycetota bacterium]